MRDKTHVVSRESDLLALTRFFETGGLVSCLVLSGEVGIGKTTVWESGLEIAAAQRYLVLSARASQAEVALSFAALADLVENVDVDVLANLPAPQLHALEVALRRRAPEGTVPDPFAISAGFLSVLRALAEHEPVLVAVDDVQWLDPSSAGALAFAARRLSGGNVRFLITRRSGRQSELERAIQPASLERLELTPLSFGATSSLLSERLGSGLTHRLLRQVHATSHGNPLFALELGRLLVAAGLPEIGGEMPVPDLVEDIFGPRVQGLPDVARRALLAVALSAGLSRSELSTIVDPLAVDDGISSGLLLVERSRVRPAHPMLAAAAMSHSSARERQDLHLQLASVIDDATLRARHLAIATVTTDAGVAGIVAEAAELAARRGAVQEAEELGAHALRLTPRDAPGRAERVLALGRFHLRADNFAGLTELLTEEMTELPAGRARAMAHLLLGEASDARGDEAHAELALVEAGEDPEVRALALAKRSRLLTLSDVERVDQAEVWALEALSAAQLVGGEVEERARTAVAWARVMRGRPIDDLRSSDPISDHGLSVSGGLIDRALGARFMFRGEVETARALLQQLLALDDERGDLQSRRLTQFLRFDLELRAGNVPVAAQLLDEVPQGLPLMDKVRARLQAMLAAAVGAPNDTRRWAAEILGARSGEVQGVDRLEAMRALGMAALFERDVTRAVESLRAVWEHALREHVDDPGVYPVAADLVEALVQSGDAASASDVTELLRRAALEQEHPWGLASAKRCAAVVQLADRYRDEAVHSLDQAAAEYGALGLNFDRGRTLLYLGGIQRRSQKRASARQSLEDAAALFESGGCAGWAARARAEIAQVSGRKSAADGQLTPSERQVVDLAVSGLSNKEIASRLYVVVNTVEVHLSHAYTKLGVRSRSQLARILGKPVRE